MLPYFSGSIAGINGRGDRGADQSQDQLQQSSEDLTARFRKIKERNNEISEKVKDKFRIIDGHNYTSLCRKLVTG